MKYFFIIICLCLINNDIFSQTVRKSSRKGRVSSGKRANKPKVKPKAITAAIDSPAVKPQIDINKEPVIPPVIIVHDTNSNPLPQLDSIKDKILSELQKMQMALAAGLQNKDSIRNFRARLDTALILKLDTLKEQTKPEDFWKGFLKNTAYQWLYDKFLGGDGKSQASIFEVVLTAFALFIRLVLLVRLIIKRKNTTDKNKKPGKLRIALSIISWTILACSFIPQTNNAEEVYLSKVKEINKKIKEIQNNNNDKITSSQYTLSTITNTTTIVQQINVDTLLKQFNKVLEAQNQLAQQQVSAQEQQKKSETEVISTVKDYSISWIWLTLVLLILLLIFFLIIFNREARDFVHKKFKF